MITCPECGLETSDGARFCDRCGQGLTGSTPATAAASSRRPQPLGPGTMLKGGYEIVELVGQDSIENRYRAIRKTDDGKPAEVILRERFGPAGTDPESPNQVDRDGDGAELGAHDEENPAGPRAKTKELDPAPLMAADGGDSEVGESQPAESGSAETGSADQAGASDPDNAASREPAAEETQAESEVYGASTESEPVRDEDGPEAEAAEAEEPESAQQDDLGDVFGKVLALSLTVNHPAFERALSGFSDQSRVYLVYSSARLTPLSRRLAAGKLDEPQAITTAIQVSQAISFMHRRGLRLNDICPESTALDSGGRVRMTGLDCVTNDNELQEEPIFNDGYTAPEIYRAKKVDKRADIFSAGALLYTMVTGERLESESWREEAGTVEFYPPHVVSPNLEQVIRRALAFSPEARWPTVDAFKAELLKLLGEMTIRSASLTDVGMVREHNEDSVMSVEYFRDSQVEPSRSFLYAVCDGMGGAEAGETASAIAVGTIRRYVADRLDSGETSDLSGLLVGALEQANTEIIEYQKEHPESRGMGSTGVVALMLPPEAGVAWVGDSRAYVLDGAGLRQVTRDHSLVQRLIEIGQISEEEARNHEHKNVITRSLGARQSGVAGAEGVALKLKRGDRLLLCSDGLTAHVEDDQIATILGRHTDPDSVARELIAAANAGGGTDNISVIIVFVT